MIYFLIYIFLEVTVSLQIADIIGSFSIFLEIIGSAILGFSIMKHSNMKLGENLQKVMSAQMSSHELQATHILNFVGALLLILPGVLTDTIGLLLQLRFIAFAISKRVARMAKESKGANPYVSHSDINIKTKPKGDSDVIDVEIVDSNSAINHK